MNIADVSWLIQPCLKKPQINKITKEDCILPVLVMLKLRQMVKCSLFFIQFVLKNKFIYLIIPALFSMLQIKSYASYDFNTSCKEAYNAIIDLNFIKAKNLIQKEKNTNKENLIPYYLDNMIDFLSIACSEDKVLFNTLKSNKDKRITLFEEGAHASPYYRYCLAEVYLQWAVARIIFDEYVTAAYEINKAYRLLTKNKEEYPGFIPNLKSLGVLHAVIGSIPDNYKWIAGIIGAQGSINEGLNELSIVLKASLKNKEYEHLTAEALYYIASICINLKNDRSDVVSIINFVESNDNIKQLSESSALVNFGVANLYIRTKYNNNKGIEILETFKPCTHCFTFNYRYYALGLSKLTRLDTDAEDYFHIFLKDNKGINFIKSAYQKLAWQCILNGDTVGYLSNMQKIKTTGFAYTEDDKQALTEAETGVIPNIQLLKARLLFDGGYYRKALNALDSAGHIVNGTNKQLELEYLYRKARIHHENGDTSLAVTHYLKTIEKGKNETYYYAANASLQLGYIYEARKDTTMAIKHYNNAIQMKNTDYRYSISQKAKAGLNRLEK